MSYNYPHLILEETKVICFKVTLQNQFGIRIAIKKNFSLGRWRRMANTTSTHKFSSRRYYYLNELCIHVRDYFSKGEKLPETGLEHLSLWVHLITKMHLHTSPQFTCERGTSYIASCGEVNSSSFISVFKICLLYLNVWEYSWLFTNSQGLKVKFYWL